MKTIRPFFLILRTALMAGLLTLGFGAAAQAAGWNAAGSLATGRSGYTATFADSSTGICEVVFP